MNGHTPGPWTTSEHQEILANQRITAEHRIFMNGAGAASVYSMGCSAAENGANARLIAAAPELLAALEAAFIEMGRSGANADLSHPARKEWEQARAAIAKATQLEEPK